MKTSRKLTSQRAQFKQRYSFFAVVQIALGIVALFEKIYHEEPIFTVFSVNGEDVQKIVHCKLSLFQLIVLYHLRTVAQPTASHRMGFP